MKIKDGCAFSTNDFWYDLTVGGYLKPEEILESENDIKTVKEAIKIVVDFQSSCENQIDGFID